MSQIVGIICKEGIVIACESQTTTASRKLFKAVKLHVIKFKNTEVVPGAIFTSALITTAGVAANSHLAIHYIEEMAQKTDLNGEYTLVEIVETCINRIRDEILKSMQKREYSIAEQDYLFSDGIRNFELMFAHYYFPDKDTHPALVKAIPCLFTASLSSPKPERCHPFAVSGIASDLASFILKDFKCEEMLWGETASLAIDALDQINETDVYCGGQIKLGSVLTVTRNSMACIYPDNLVNRVLNKVRPKRKEIKEKYRQSLEDAMKQIHNEDFKLVMESAKECEEQEKRS